VVLTLSIANHEECTIRRQCYRGIVVLSRALLFIAVHAHVGNRVIQGKMRLLTIVKHLLILSVSFERKP